MTRVAFWYDRPQEYSGGLNYMRNLLHAIKAARDPAIEPYVFFGHKVDAKVVEGFRPLAEVVRTSVLDRKSVPWFVHKLLFKLFGSLAVVKLTLRRHGISIVSHAETVYGRRQPLLVISWIPDFQYLHLPDMFPGLDTAAQTKRLREIIAGSDAIVLSSHAALQDYRRIAAESDVERATVLQFVSQPSERFTNVSDDPTRRRAIEDKYSFRSPFFLLPNQFWLHKNHVVVFEAVRVLAQQGVEVLVLCTGNLRDYRLNDTSYADALADFVQRHALQERVRILGLIDYDDVLYLMRHCLAMINPSRFEGWSSTVEEAKSIGKQVVLSNIEVHLEQAPPDARFFAPDDVGALAAILAELWHAGPEGDAQSREDAARAALHDRTVAYGRSYANLVHQLAAATARPQHGNFSA
jgi:glycosyltransferase involved in cell wall biosynthesis